ncbi:MAG: hypothetical protein ABSF32_10345 [Ignavibacteria bacterium]|jgi:hypothetical protein
MRKPNKSPRQINPKKTKVYETKSQKRRTEHQGFQPGTGQISQLRKTGKRG